MHFPRSSGILFHPTSLPGRYGVGDLGLTAYQFVDFLADAGQQFWQILPLNPTGYGNSPYQSPSAFAGNPLLISPDMLVEEGLLDEEEIGNLPGHFQMEDRVNFDAVTAFKNALFQRSFERFQSQKGTQHQKAYEEFCTTNANWLPDYALFMALREQMNFACWNTWERDIALRKPEALEACRKNLADQVAYHTYLQYVFHRQWLKLRAYANENGVRILGDIPIYVAYDSADVWANPHLYKLDQAGNPTVVAGVPPDYFSATGQRWGNPIYRWDQMAKDDFFWWMERLRQTLTLVDVVRIDHFRGLESYWEVPSSEETAINGKWVKGPGGKFFTTIKNAFGDLPIIAEDLGIITPEVERLRDRFNLHGMKVLHFAFGDDSNNPYLPHNYRSTNCVVYTGTHDNNTTIGWFSVLLPGEREAVQRYLGRDGSDIAWDLIRVALMSVADIAIVPLQDVLRLGAEARMNTPGTSTGNWEWRLRPRMLTPGLAQGLRTLTFSYKRCEEKKLREEGLKV